MVGLPPVHAGDVEAKFAGPAAGQTAAVSLSALGDSWSGRDTNVRIDIDRTQPGITVAVVITLP